MDSAQKKEPAGLVAAIGASAGGVEVLAKLFVRLPRRTGIAYLVLLHSKPTHEPLLVEILAGKTSLPVVGAREGLPVEADTIYVMPPGLGVRVDGGRTLLARLSPRPSAREAIDALFRSLAVETKERAIGVVLSGTGSDGAAGLQAIRTGGGIALAQAPDSAEFDAMPCHAIEQGAVDCVLTPDGLADTLARIGLDAPTGLDAETPCISTGDLEQVFGILRTVSGMDFSLYKSSTIQRRLARRLSLHHIGKIGEYLELLNRDPAEAMALCQDFLIRVTEFFREAGLFEDLAAEVCSRLLRDRSANDPIRIWVPGCSTGEEVYSLAMVLREFLDQTRVRPPLLLFGSDLSQEAIDRARAGLYPAEALRPVSLERRERFFSPQDGQYQIRPEIRDVCVFAKHNVARDPPFSKLDFISCCNLLIYFGPALQKRVITTFHYALKPGGLLRLGSSERVGAHGARLFSQVDRQRPLYFKKDEPADLHTELGPFTENLMSLSPARPDSTEPPSPPDLEALQREIDRLILERYTPAGLVVDARLDVLRFTGQIGTYLQPQPGPASLNLSRLVEPNLQVAIAAAIGEARTSDGPVRRENFRVQTTQGEKSVHLSVASCRSRPGGEAWFLVLLEDPGGRRPDRRGWLENLVGVFRPGAGSGESPERLQLDLESARRDLRSLAEAREVDQEELKSVREELLSAREEFQSTSEELETAQEELKSANEELITANEELRIRNAELSKVVGELREARDYAQAIVDTVWDGLLVLDGDLRVRRANRAILEALRLPAAAVEGQTLTDIGYGALASAPLLDKLRQLAAGGAPIENCEFNLDIPPVGRRILIGNAWQLKGEGDLAGLILLSLLDVSRRRQDEIRLRQQGELLDQAHEAIFAWSLGGPILYWNRGAGELYGYTAEEAIGQRSHELLKTRRDIGDAEFDGLLRRDRRWIGQVLHTTRDGRELLMDSRYTVHEEDDGSLLVLETNRDITERRQWEESLQRADRQKDEFLAMLAHELRNPLAPLRNALAILERADPARVPAAELRAMMERQVTKLTRIVDDLLDIARITRGQIELRREHVDLVDLAGHSAEAIRPQAEDAGHRLLLQLPEGPVVVHADPVRVEQVLENLLCNAVRYTPSGGEIELALEKLDGHAVLRVRDNGQGISAEALPHIFDLFVQSDRSLDRRQGGLGIGLTLVRRLAELHGGWAKAESDGVGRGSRFSVGLPLAAAAASPERRDSGGRGQQSKRVLVVDDNGDATASAAVLTEYLGHEVRVALDPATALAVAAEFRPEVVLLDIGLPGMDGYELARRLRGLEGMEQVLLVAVSGYGSDRDREASVAAGIDRHLVKPVAAEVLEEIIGGNRGEKP